MIMRYHRLPDDLAGAQAATLDVDLAEYAAKVAPELDACFQDDMITHEGTYAARRLRLNSAGGLALVRLLEKHGFVIVRRA